jgi:hypothetical protein
MAHKDWNSIDETNQSFEEVYCAFLDILGYKNKADAFFKNEFNLFGRVERALQSTNEVKEISTLFLDELNTLQISFFSDSIIIISPPHAKAFYCILHYVKVLSTYLSYEGLFVRGGISFGKHFSRNTNTGSLFLASEALQNAYIHESKHAIYPRILIDKHLYNRFTTVDKDSIIQDGNDYVVHFSPMIINKDGNNLDEVYLEMEDIYNEREKYDAEIRLKYEWLLDYYYWTITLIRHIDINRFKKFKSDKARDFRQMHL